MRIQTTEPWTDWTKTHGPAANTPATCTQAAAGAGKRNVCTGLTVMLVSNTVAPAAAAVVVRLIDGASGGTTYLWEMRLSLPATAGAASGAVRENLFIVGSPNTAMTLEFSAAGGANTFESVSMEGAVIG